MARYKRRVSQARCGRLYGRDPVCSIREQRRSGCRLNFFFRVESDAELSLVGAGNTNLRARASDVGPGAGTPWPRVSRAPLPMKLGAADALAGQDKLSKLE